MAFERATGFEYRSDETGWLVTAGEPWIDFNCALVFPGLDAVRRMDEAAACFREKALPFLVCSVGENAETHSAAQRLGLSCAGTLPLMVLLNVDEMPAASGPSPMFAEASSAEDFRAVAQLSHACFGIPIDSIKRVMPFDRPLNARIHTLTASLQGEFVGAVTYTLQEDGAGIWSMMTRPDLRRRGIAQALMREAALRIRRSESRPIFLVSTPAGKPLYDRLGFETVDSGTVWTGLP